MRRCYVYGDLDGQQTFPVALTFSVYQSGLLSRSTLYTVYSAMA